MNRIVFLLFFIILTNYRIYSRSFDFLHIDNTNGLSNNQVECIFKDSRGFIWFGTNLGLNRYDGFNFKIYKRDKHDENSIPDRITSIKEDINGNLWVSSTGNTFYSMYNCETECFVRDVNPILSQMGLPPSPIIIEIDTDKNFYLYYSDKGIVKYNVHSREQTIYEQSPEMETLSEGTISNLKIRDGYIWVLFDDGLLERIDENNMKVDMRNYYFKENSRNTTIVKTIFIDSDNDLWLFPSVDDKGLAYFDTKKRSWNFLDQNGTALSLSSNFVRTVGQDNNGLIWIGTDHGGVNIFDKQKKEIKVLRNDVFNNHSIGQNSIISIFCDNDGIVWTGTYKNGVSYYHPNMFKFKKPPLLNHFKQDSEIFDCNVIIKDRADNLWIGTNGRGLIRYNETSELFTIYTHNSSGNSLSSNIITALKEDHEGVIWIGTFLGGMNAYYENKFTSYQIDENNPNSLSNKSVYGITEDNENNLWIATLGGGVNKLDITRKQFTRHNTGNTPQLSSNYILSMFTDIYKNIYLSTDAGLSIIDSKDYHIQPYFKDKSLADSLSSTTINNALNDSRNLLWVATDNGINVYDPVTKKFSYITTRQGLPTDEVVSLIEDNNGNIWAGTRNGLAYIFCHYDKGKLDYNVVYFDTKDGLPSSVCNQNAIYKDKNGIIYIGCTKGYISFKPDDIVFNEKIPQARFTDLLIANEIIKPSLKYGNRVILPKTISDLEKISLNYDHTNFTLLFSAFNYLHPEKNRYKYMLEGLDKEWTEIKNGIGAASYSNLNPGTYKLIVYASNDDGLWSEKALTMEIVVEPPFWMTWWAYLIYLLIIAGIIRWFVKYKLKRQKQEFEQAQKIMEINKTHELDELKFRFFTNISHEFKTPITLILTPLEKLLKETVTNEQRSLLNIMRRNALNLLNMVNEILEFRKLDLNKMRLSLSSGDIISFVKEICLSFSSLASEESIKLTFTTYLEELQMDFDPEKMNKIVSNLLSNAFKFTEEGHVDVSIGITESVQKDEQRLLSIKVSDTGIGIEEQYLDKIFERFFRIDNPQKVSPGTGVGLHLVSEYVKLHKGEIQVESTQGKGSTFTVLVPIHNSKLKELVNQDIIHSGKSKQADDYDQQQTENILENKNRLPVLLAVDDNEDFREFIKKLFSDSYRVITANDGEEAWQEVLDDLPDLILCDVMMPKMDGYEFCRKVKGDIRTSHIPVILLTAKSSDENRYSGIEAGSDDYISKPFNIDMLTLKISKIIEKQKKYQSNFRKKIDISPSEIKIMTMDEKFVKKAVSIVEQNIEKPEFLVEDLCREMGMSRVYFYKKTLALTDKTPSEFIRFIRLKRAADLLEKSQMFVNEVAFQVGFNDPKYFRKYFKEEFGMTPTEYKKKFTDEG